jgi:hypothetical protein
VNWQTPDPCEPPPRDAEEIALRARVVTIGEVADVCESVVRHAQRDVMTATIVALEIRRQLERRSREP